MRAILIAATILTGFAASNADATVIVSVAYFSFEAPIPAEYYYNPTVTDVAFNGPAGTSGNGGSGISANGSAFNFSPAPAGSQVAFIQNASGQAGLQGQVSLTVTGLTIGELYKASFYTAARHGFTSNPLLVTFDGATVGSATSTSTSFVRSVTTVFTATSTTGFLTFTGQGATSGDADIALDAVNVSTVPEPTSWALMIAGFGLTGFAMRRRAARKLALAA